MRKLAYIDCNNKYYKSLSNEEVNVLKKIKFTSDRKNLGSCPKHGLYEKSTITSYDEYSNKSKFYGACLKCVKEEVN